MKWLTPHTDAFMLAPGIHAFPHPVAERCEAVCGRPYGQQGTLQNAGPITEFIHEPPHADIFEGWQVFENPPVLENDGTIKVPQGPGLGVTFRADLIEEF